MIKVGLLVLFEVALVAVAAVRQAVRAPAQRRPLWVVCAAWHALPFWVLWRAACGRVLRLASGRAVRACEAYERAQATATYPAQDAGTV